MASRASFLLVTPINGPASYALFPASSLFGCYCEGVPEKKMLPVCLHYHLMLSSNIAIFILTRRSPLLKTNYYSFGYLVKLLFLIPLLCFLH
jgi:hypothetical protein